MNSQELQSALLNTFSFITESFMKKMNEYNIQTVGQLLSATKGLTIKENIFETDDERNILSKLMEIIPTEILEEHASFQYKHSMGLIKKENQNENTNNGQDK